MAEEGFRRKLTAVFSADAAGYSRLMAEDEAATVKTIAAYRDAMASLIKQHRGRVVDSPGDNVLAEFPSVVDAVQCAVAVQKELQARNAELPDNRRMDFRIGINLGDVIEEDDRIYGDGVNIAARLEALADPGGICVSKTAFDHIESKLPLGYEYLGEQEVKNIPKPVGAYRVLLEPRITVAGEIEKEKAVPLWRRKSILAGSVALIVLIIAALIWNFYFRPLPVEVASVEKMAFSLPDKPSIAVLPFVNMTEDPGQEYFSDGLTEEIITALSKIRGLFVIASHSTFSYKDRPVKVRQVAEQLGVQYVLEGSVRRSEERIRIAAQLIDAIKGHHLWSERYDRTVSDIFALQDDITKNIIIALQVKMMPGEDVPVYARGTDNLDAYLKAMEGWWHYTQWTREGASRAQQLAQEAIALDPRYAYAYHVLGASHRLVLWLGLAKFPQESLKSSIELDNKAISLDSSLAIAHAGLGYSLVLARQYDRAIAAGERALSLEPHSANVLYSHGSVLMFAGRNEEAITLFQEALRLNPKPNNNLYRHFGNALANTGRYEEAIALQKKAIEQNPNDIFAYMVMASVCSMAGREAEARAAAKEVLRLNPNFSVRQVRNVRPDKDRAVAKRWCNTLREAGLPETPPLPLPDKPSIAVLPFVNMSGDPEQEYFSDGITEEIITGLSKVPRLFVIARNSSFTYKGKSVWIPTVGMELGVRYVLEGSVRKAGDKVRITAQLIDAKTNNHLWAERYDKDLKDIFAIQDEVTMKIVAAMEVRLTEGEQALVHGRGTDNLDAYLKLLEGRNYRTMQNKEDILRARRKFEEALAQDPNYASAYANLAWTYMMEVPLGVSKSPGQSITRAIEFTQKALERDDSLADAHGLLGWLYTLTREYEKGIAECERAIALEPNSAIAHLYLGTVLRYAGRAEEGIPAHRQAIRLNPFPLSGYFYGLGMSYGLTRQYEEAINACRKAVELEPRSFVARAFLTAVYSMAGREEEARVEAAEVTRMNPQFLVESWTRTMPFKNRADLELVIDALRKAGLK